MRQRKTDDEVILRMLKEGKTQKQIAGHFGVSPTAVHKRVRRLCLPEMPHFDKLTDKEKRFVIEKARGKTATQAVLDSYEVTSRESAKVMGSQLMAKPEIQMSMEELMAYCGANKLYRIRRLKQIIDSADLNLVHKGLDMSFKLDGSYAPEKIDMNPYHMQPIPEEHIAFLRELGRKYAEEIRRNVIDVTPKSEED
ncbi:MAG: terminase small subunit [Nitrospirota bacterium]